MNNYNDDFRPQNTIDITFMEYGNTLCETHDIDCLLNAKTNSRVDLIIADMTRKMQLDPRFPEIKPDCEYVFTLSVRECSKPQT